ncbi:MAG: EutN/CcmL family microcompartment protein, partial [Deltaproteobacteria bacterium]|nr:EutN/CcmL family microcompartment protein [Deltaproteobacteria bacterium]
MRLARVEGQIWGSKSAEGIEGQRLLIARPLKAVAGTHSLVAEKSTIVVVDALGAGPGELVLTAHGSRCRDLTLGEHTPTKELVIAIVD